ncbi:Arylsulfatase [Myxococcaceae bacterium]|nr:Arylsulfatase [Myxococcaceae bacterium]
MTGTSQSEPRGRAPGFPRRRGRGSQRLLALLAGIAAALMSACSAPPPERIVLVTIDTLRADHVGAFGSERAKTATLDALAREGVRFDAAFSPVPLTLPSHTTLMTALDPPRHGVRHNSIFQVPVEIPTLAERMKESGRATAAFVGALVLESRFGLDRGFGTYDDRMGERRSGFVGFAERPADRVVDAALGWLEKAPERFFLWVHFYDPHALYEPPLGYALSFASSPYDGEIAFTDAQLGRLLRAIDERFGAQGTLVAVTSDHGESLGEHLEPTHSYSIYDATQRIPLILRGAGLPAGRSISELVRLSDVAPTLLELAELPPLDEVDGRSLLPLVRGDRDEPRQAYLETLATELDLGWAPLFGLRDQRSKLIRAPRPELYDLESDPRELENRAGAETGRVASLDASLAELLARARPLEAPIELGAGERARLESLGYVVPTAGAVEKAAASTGQGPDPKDEIPLLATVARASMLVAKGRPGEAFALLAAAGDRGPYLLSVRANAALAAERPADAERDARLALATSPDRGDLHQILAESLLRQGRLDEAHSAFERAREAEPRHARPLLGLGQVAEALRDPGSAEQHYRAALDASRMSEEVPEGAWRLASLLLEQGRGDEADSLLVSLPGAVVETEAAAVRIARAELGAGRHDAALARLEAARERHPESAPILLLFGHVLERKGRGDEARAARERALELAPGAAAARNDLAWSLARQGRDLDRALALAEAAHGAAPGSVEFADTLALVRLRRGEAAAALTLLDATAPAASGDAKRSLGLRRAEALLALGRRAAAREAFEKAVGPGDLPSPPPDWAEGASELARRLGLSAPSP